MISIEIKQYLIEAHGTGTPLGDPVELAALTRVFDAVTVHASKAIFGHCETAAGVAGVYLAMERLTGQSFEDWLEAPGTLADGLRWLADI